MKILTKDLYEAAYLLSKGMKIAKVFGGRNTVLLEIEGDEALDVLKNKYQSQEAVINIHSLKKQMREVRDIVFAVLRESKVSGKEISYSLT